MKRMIRLYIEKENGSIYAWSDDKSLCKSFESTRNMNWYHIRDIKIKDKKEYVLFLNTYNTSKLNRIPLSCYENQNLEIVGTSREEIDLDRQCELILNRVTSLRRALSQYDLSEYQDDIDNISQIVKKRVVNDYVLDQVLMIDTYDLFVHLNSMYIYGGH